MIVSVEEAAKLISSGQIVAFPTETVYGLGADAKNASAIQKTFDIKGRPPDNPIIVHISDINQISGLATDIPQLFYTLSEVFWPGPISFVLKKHPSVPDLVTAGLNTVAVRMPDHQLALALIQLTGPLTAPSANKSGKPSPTKPGHIVEDYGNELPIVDGGVSSIGLESTVLNLTSTPPSILRPGAISAEMIEKIIGMKITEDHPGNLQGAPISPGIKYTHYKPKAEVNWIPELPQNPDPKVYYLSHSLKLPKHEPNIVAFSGDFNMMAQQLYDHFRTADHLGYSQILIEKLPENSPHPLITPLVNRITKAISN